MLLRSPTQLSYAPRRIISLVPSLTELLYQLGLYQETVAITKFCIHPEEWYRNKIRVGGTKNLDLQRIVNLKPDLIIANKEENVKEQVLELAKSIPVWVTDINSLENSLEMIADIGQLTNTIRQSSELIINIKKAFNLRSAPTLIPAAYLIWKDPWMSVGGDTFIHDMLGRAGFKNVFDQEVRYPQVSIGALKVSRAKVLLLSSEPYPFKQQHIEELQEQIPGIRILLVDGEMFSWYGSRLLKAPAYFRELRERLDLGVRGH
ncbi:MAG: cobalamin-binding protein [Chitinophagaceae bacterium]|nr:MAG: cobalamin-binding protein [Chitinophagaceae bacterium]